MFVRIVPTSILHRRPQVLGSIGATTIVTRGGTQRHSVGCGHVRLRARRHHAHGHRTGLQARGGQGDGKKRPLHALPRRDQTKGRSEFQCCGKEVPGQSHCRGRSLCAPDEPRLVDDGRRKHRGSQVHRQREPGKYPKHGALDPRSIAGGLRRLPALFACPVWASKLSEFDAARCIGLKAATEISKLVAPKATLASAFAADSVRQLGPMNHSKPLFPLREG